MKKNYPHPVTFEGMSWTNRIFNGIFSNGIIIEKIWDSWKKCFSIEISCITYISYLLQLMFQKGIRRYIDKYIKVFIFLWILQKINKKKFFFSYIVY